MRRRLSSAQTFLMKFVFPPFWILLFAQASVLFFTSGAFAGSGESAPPPEMKWLMLAAIVAGALCIYWFCMRLKQVELDEQYLYVSNFVREIRIPLQDIEEVSENRWVNIRPITLEFRRDTDFGSRIIFMPKTRWWGFWRSHPAVGEIESAIRRARGLPAEDPAV